MAVKFTIYGGVAPAPPDPTLSKSLPIEQPKDIVQPRNTAGRIEKENPITMPEEINENIDDIKEERIPTEKNIPDTGIGMDR